mgnify:FL=1
MADLMSPPQFHKALEQAREGNHSTRHPLSAAWANAELTREQLGFYGTQHYYYIASIPQQFAQLYVRLPDLHARQHLLENLVGEEDPAAPDKRHPDLLLNFVEACGLPREVTMTAEQRDEILPAVRAMRAWIWELVGFRTLAEASAGIMVALEGQLPRIYSAYIAAMRSQGFTDDELEFFHVHVENDTEHAAIGLEICTSYATTPELQAQAIAAVRASVALRWQMLSSIYAALPGRQQAA